MSTDRKYQQRGVSAGKEEVHRAIRRLDKGLFPNAFCKVLPDVVAGDPEFCNLMHADTAGTKTSLAYLYWRETGDLSVWEGIAQDALVMNLDDMACVGCVDDILVSSTIGRNKHLIPGEVLEVLIGAGQRFAETLADYGIHLHLAGGETADVGDIVRTLDVGYTTFARMPRKDLIVNDIPAGACIVGVASFGQASYEKAYNSGIGSNGLTSARHDVLSTWYAQNFPESFSPETPSEVVYCGSRRLTDRLRIDGIEYEVGQLLLSPTRTYLPLIRKVLEHCRPALHGIIHNTGGGQTKVLKFLDRKRAVKDNLFDPPPVFQLIRQESSTDWQEMFQVFNMGHRLEFYVEEPAAQQIIDLAADFNLMAQVVGSVEDAPDNEVEIRFRGERLRYLEK